MCVDHPGVQLPMPAGLLTHAHNEWLESAKRVRVSELQKDVSRVLRNLGNPHEIERLTEDQLFSLDMALEGDVCFTRFIQRTIDAKFIFAQRRKVEVLLLT